MSDAAQSRMTVDEFFAWNEDNPGRFELVDGRLYAMSPERLRHAKTKGLVFTALTAAVARGSLPCEVYPDGVTVRLDATTAFEPDALVRCGPPLDDNAVDVPDALIVVEVLSPGTRNYDAGAKFAGYFTLPSIRHYLMVDPDRALVVHHRRHGEAIDTRIHAKGSIIRLDPPGLDFSIDDVFPTDKG